MNFITTTELRTRVPLILDLLSRGEAVELVHRSRVVGDIKPRTSTTKTISARELQKKIDALGLPKLTDKEIDRRYRAAMMKKHGKGLL